MNLLIDNRSTTALNSMSINNNSISNKQTAVVTAILCALSQPIPTFYEHEISNICKMSSVACIEYSNAGTLALNGFRQTDIKAKVISMLTPEGYLTALVENTIFKMQRIGQVKNIEYEIDKENKTVNFQVSIFMPKYDRPTMRELISIKIYAENIADEIDYMLDFKYMPLMEA